MAERTLPRERFLGRFVPFRKPLTEPAVTASVPLPERNASDTSARAVPPPEPGKVKATDVVVLPKPSSEHAPAGIPTVRLQNAEPPAAFVPDRATLGAQTTQEAPNALQIDAARRRRGKPRPSVERTEASVSVRRTDAAPSATASGGGRGEPPVRKPPVGGSGDGEPPGSDGPKTPGSDGDGKNGDEQPEPQATPTIEKPKVKLVPITVPTDPVELQTLAETALPAEGVAMFDRLTGWLKGYARLRSPREHPNGFALSNLKTGIDFSHVSDPAVDKRMTEILALSERPEGYRIKPGSKDNKVAAAAYNGSLDRIQLVEAGLAQVNTWFTEERQLHQEAQDSGVTFPLNPDRLKKAYEVLQLHSAIPTKETLQIHVGIYDALLSEAEDHSASTPGIVMLPGAMLSSHLRSRIADREYLTAVRYLDDAVALQTRRTAAIDLGNTLYHNFRGTAKDYGIEVAGQLLSGLTAAKTDATDSTARDAIKQRGPRAQTYMAVDAYLTLKAREVERLMNQIDPGSAQKPEHRGVLAKLTTPVLQQYDQELVAESEAQVSGSLSSDANRMRDMLVGGIARVRKSIRETGRTRTLADGLLKLTPNGGDDRYQPFTIAEGGLLFTLLVAPDRFETFATVLERLREGTGDDVAILQRDKPRIYETITGTDFKLIVYALLQKLKFGTTQEAISAIGLTPKRIQEVRLVLGQYLDPGYTEEKIEDRPQPAPLEAGGSNPPPPPTAEAPAPSPEPQPDPPVDGGTDFMDQVPESLADATAPTSIQDVLDTYEKLDYPIFPIGHQAREEGEAIIREIRARRPSAKIDKTRIDVMVQLAQAMQARDQRLGISEADSHMFITRGTLGNRGTVMTAGGQRVGNEYLVLVMLTLQPDGTIHQRCFGDSPVEEHNAAYLWDSEVVNQPYPDWEVIFGGEKRNARDPENGGARILKHTAPSDRGKHETMLQRAYAVFNGPAEEFYRDTSHLT